MYVPHEKNIDNNLITRSQGLQRPGRFVVSLKTHESIQISMARNCSKELAARAARLLCLVRSITFLISGVVV